MQSQIVTPGLVLREVKVGESDKILTLLTPEHGIITASAKGSLRLKSKLFSGCGLFCYSEFTLFGGRTIYKVNDAQVKQVFHGITGSVEAMALAMYMAEVAIVLAPSGPEAAVQLRLLLNSLYLAGEGKKDLHQIKAVYEMRSMTEGGYMPDLLCCKGCGRYDDALFCFDPFSASLLCPDCAAKQGKRPNLTGPALTALRHIALVEDKRIFSFWLAPQSLTALERVTQQYLLTCLDRPLKSLEFLNTVLPPPMPDPQPDAGQAGG